MVAAQPQLISDETLLVYRQAGGRMVEGYRVGDYAVRRQVGDGKVTGFEGSDMGELRDGAWLVDHVPTGMLITSFGEKRALAWLVADSLAWAVDGVTTPQELQERIEEVVPWMVEQARRATFGEVPSSLLCWSREHGLVLRRAAVVTDEDVAQASSLSAEPFHG